ncbi:MAG: hypothetical protein KDB01_04530 [Planctomycetaceae bacterium]|nr:hypothetical protein [Planctomycetaceae bacterium]
MLVQIELFCLGFAAVIDVVLLLVVMERVNRPLTAIWLKWALAGTALWHAGCFLHTLLRDTQGSSSHWLDAACMTSMAAGLLLLTSAVLHAALRMHFSADIVHPTADYRYLAVYSPLFFIVAVAASIVRSGSRDFIHATDSYQIPYLAWLSVANVTAAALFMRNRNRLAGVGPAFPGFLAKFSAGLVIITVITNAYIMGGQRSRYEHVFRLATSLSPVVPTLVFAWYVFRRRLLPLVFERTLVYGAILLASLYLHRLTISPVMSRFTNQWQIDFVVLEGLGVVFLILAYQPLRNRIQESLRYLISGHVAEDRDAVRQLSVELSIRPEDSREALAGWFAGQLQECLRVRFAAVVFSDTAAVASVVSAQDESLDLITADIRKRMSELRSIDTDRWVDLSRSRDLEQIRLMRELRLIAIFPFRCRGVCGCLLLGELKSGDRLSEEQLNSTALIVDQFAATVHNAQLQAARLSAERRAVQQEKLSVLGLLSGSLAHELKNPLSSIRTIATLLKEDLPRGSEQACEVELIIAEIDRLTRTTQRLLDFSRPSDEKCSGVAPDRIIQRLLHVLGHLARQYDVTLQVDLTLDTTLVAASDASVSEILFNLIKNAIEAVRGEADRCVTIHTSRLREPALHSTVCSADTTSAPSTVTDMAVISVRDTGPGIASEHLQDIFQPFVTGKSDGTGLGLYLVGERVRELQGTVTCFNDRNQTVFEVRLPVYLNNGAA